MSAARHVQEHGRQLPVCVSTWLPAGRVRHLLRGLQRVRGGQEVRGRGLPQQPRQLPVRLSSGVPAAPLLQPVCGQGRLTVSSWRQLNLT